MSMPGWTGQMTLGAALALGGHFLYVGARVKPLRRRAWLGLALACLPLAVLATGSASQRFPAALGLALGAVAGAVYLAHRYLALHVADREALRALSQAYGELRASAHMRELGVSAASISHEIRNYAATLKGNAALLDRNLEEDARRGELDRIRVAADRMEAIARDISAFSRASAPLRPEPLLVDDVIRSCLRERFPGKPAHVRCLGAARVRGDAARLEQAFMNFFRNAWEAGATRLDARVTAWRGRVIVALEDDGRGCPPEDLDRITAPFFSRKGASGTGLGCSISESILRAHDATLRAYSKNALGGTARGLVLNLVFPAEGGGPQGHGPELVALCGPGPVRDNLIRPMLHVGIRPRILDSDAAPGAWAGVGSAGPLILDAGAAGRLAGLPADAPRVVVGPCREAVRTPGRETFLFTEEALIGLVGEP